MSAEEDFVRLTDPFRAELLAYCYRMLGSVHDAEDQVQETYLRAWRSYGEFQGRASLRTWLYRIATNVCLRALERRDRRPLPSGLGGPGADPDGPLNAASPEVPWLQPLPDALLVAPTDPAVIVASRHTMRLALIAALQHLPARQRAVLILRDVLRMPAAEVAALLGTTNVAVNSGLQRARAQLERRALTADEIAEPTDPDQRALLDRYAAAMENADIPAITQLLAEDAIWEMPPIPTWFAGPEAAGRLLASHVFAVHRDLRMIPTAANAQPAFAMYSRGHDGIHRAHAVQVISTAGPRITRATAFLDPDLFATFGLPPTLPAAAAATPAAR